MSRERVSPFNASSARVSSVSAMLWASRKTWTTADSSSHPPCRRHPDRRRRQSRRAPPIRRQTLGTTGASDGGHVSIVQYCEHSGLQKSVEAKRSRRVVYHESSRECRLRATGQEMRRKANEMFRIADARLGVYLCELFRVDETHD